MKNVWVANFTVVSVIPVPVIRAKENLRPCSVRNHEIGLFVVIFWETHDARNQTKPQTITNNITKR